MLAEMVLAVVLVTLSLAGLGIGLFLGRGAPRGSCATAALEGDGVCPACGRRGDEPRGRACR